MEKLITADLTKADLIKTDLDRAGLTSIVVVAADSGADLLYCVERMLADPAPVDLIVSDNASSDGSIDALATRWSADARLRIIHNGKNIGFGAGCNRAAAHARGDAILFLNPDCRLDPGVIARCRAMLAGDNGIGLLGTNIIDLHGKIEPASRRRDPTLRRALMSLSGLAHFEPHWPELAGVNMLRHTRPPGVDSALAGAMPVEEVEAVSGAFMLIRRAVFDRIGAFDEGYFLHCEDLDLCRRVRDLGFRVVCANDVSVVHLKGTSGRKRPFFVARHKHRGMWRWFVKFDPAARNPLLRALVWCGLWAHFVLLTPRYAYLALRSRVGAAVRRSE